MLSIARVELPSQVEVRLKTATDLVDNVMEFARDDLIGFKRPLAAVFAFSAPVVIAFAFQSGGWRPALEIGALYAVGAAIGLLIVGRRIWPALVSEFETRAAAKRRAIADLKCGFGEASFLNHSRPPRFIEHDHGVLAFADAGDFRTLFLSIDRDDADPRWSLYAAGEMHRRVWRWMRLPVSRELVKFSCEGTKLSQPSKPFRVRSIDAWEAIHAALGEPLDGAIIHRPFDEVVDVVDRLV
jgi:hypothetical protein